MSDPQTKLGQLIEGEQLRDAVHIAVAPMVAAITLQPGEDVGIDKNGQASINVNKNYIGIVDPFLKASVKQGQKFWLFLYPNTITSLKHVWTHPAFSDEVTVIKSKRDSENWLRNFLENVDGPDYNLLIDAAMSPDGCSSKDDYYYVSIDDWGITSHGSDAHGQIPSEFWDHLEVVTGKKFPHHHDYFSCSC